MNEQPSLFDERPRFHGPTLEASDLPRLARQMDAVRELMLDGEWRTLATIQKATGAPESSASARLRDLRREGFAVERQRVPNGQGLHRYKVTKGAT